LKVLEEVVIYKRQGLEMTPQGFKFILSSTNNQLNQFLRHYVQYFSKFYKKSQIILFILDLSLTSPYKRYQ